MLKTILSIVGGVRNPCISSKYFLRPRDGIADPDAGRLWASQEFQVLWPVVVAYPVAVMDRLCWQQVAAEDLLHHEYVFEDILEPPTAFGTSSLHHQLRISNINSPIFHDTLDSANSSKVLAN